MNSGPRVYKYFNNLYFLRRKFYIMSYISNPTLYLKSETHNNGLFNNVIQKGNWGSTYLYALQYHKKENYVFRGTKGYSPNYSQVYHGASLAAGHTQTLEYAGQSGTGHWFIGTKPNDQRWATQIARVKLPDGTHYNNADFPRLAYLNRAGGYTRVNGSQYKGNLMLRSDAAVSPESNHFLLFTVDRNSKNSKYGVNGYFTLFDLDRINNDLDNAGSGYVNLENEPYISNFNIPNITTEIGSLQGVDLDERNNIYISSEYAPTDDDYNTQPKKIVKIPWEASSSSQWDIITFDNANLDIDIAGYATELESVQVVGENDLYLTVSYHNKGSRKTTMSRLYEVKW